MRKKRLLLAATALTTMLGACEKKKRPLIYANPKGDRQQMMPDAGVEPDAAPADPQKADPPKPT